MEYLELVGVLTLYQTGQLGQPTVGLAPNDKIFLGPPTKGGSAKNPYTILKRLNLSYKVTWVRSQRVNLYNH
jgi:hypothetical protein